MKCIKTYIDIAGSASLSEQSVPLTRYNNPGMLSTITEEVIVKDGGKVTERHLTRLNEYQRRRNADKKKAAASANKCPENLDKPYLRNEKELLNDNKPNLMTCSIFNDEIKQELTLINEKISAFLKKVDLKPNDCIPAKPTNSFQEFNPFFLDPKDPVSEKPAIVAPHLENVLEYPEPLDPLKNQDYFYGGGQGYYYKPDAPAYPAVFDDQRNKQQGFNFNQLKEKLFNLQIPFNPNQFSAQEIKDTVSQALRNKYNGRPNNEELPQYNVAPVMYTFKSNQIDPAISREIGIGNRINCDEANGEICNLPQEANKITGNID